MDSTTGLRTPAAADSQAGSPRDLRPVARLTVLALIVLALVDMLHTVIAVGHYEHRVTAVTHGNADVQPAWAVYELWRTLLPGGMADAVADWSWIAAWIVAAAAVIGWLDAARRNAARLSGSPAWAQWWAIGGWFIPAANLVIPFLVTRDVKRATGTAARSAPVAAWWSAVLVTLLLHVLGWLYPTVTSRGGVFHHTTLDTRWAAYPLWSAQTAMTVFTAILTARVVGAITQAQRWSTQAQRWTQTRSSAR